MGKERGRKSLCALYKPAGAEFAMILPGTSIASHAVVRQCRDPWHRWVIGPLTGIQISGESERVFGQIASVAGADAERAGREESLRMGEIRDFSWKVGGCSPHVRVTWRYCKFATDFQLPE
jgi:hypothetical protein